MGDAAEGIVKSVNYALWQMGYEASPHEAIRKTIGLSLNHTYMVDAKTAWAAGVKFAGITTGTTSKAELKEYGCVGIYDTLTALQEKL